VAPNFKRRATPRQIARSIQELALLWAKPPDPDPDPDKEAAAGVGTEAAADQSTIERSKCTAAGPPSARGTR